MYIYIYIHIYLIHWYSFSLFHLVCKCEPCSLLTTWFTTHYLVHYLNSELVLELELHIIENEQSSMKPSKRFCSIYLYIYLSLIDPILLSYLELLLNFHLHPKPTPQKPYSLPFILTYYYTIYTYPYTTHPQSLIFTHTILPPPQPHTKLPNLHIYLYILHNQQTTTTISTTTISYSTKNLRWNRLMVNHTIHTCE